MRKINSVFWGPKVIGAGLLIGLVAPIVFTTITGRYIWAFTIIGAFILVAFGVVLSIELMQEMKLEKMYDDQEEDI